MRRIYHPWTAWECVPAGLYNTLPPSPMRPEEGREAYAVFLRDTPRFTDALARVLAEWPISCEQFLSNEHINRVAWLGQASMCIETGVPAAFRSGFFALTLAEQRIANATAQQALSRWLQHRSAGRRSRDQVHDVLGQSRLFA